MHYQSKNAGSLSGTWNQIVDTLVVMSPGLFGCKRVTLKNVVSKKEVNDLSAVLQKLGAAKIAEAHEQEKCHHEYFRVEKRPIVLIQETGKPTTLIAPAALIEYVQDELKIVLS
jgi:hypothetical protein